ncbi:T9SS type A sorting domain-containing protein [Altibacter sp.]|uniref:T9SS type A sorting domain-containing protein n=1 Tax=Altibacter sp. TaxID=2024823 RepID=UPI00258BF636|nr:T9SS type A sorting domain-containing protein [Altibacter sp.]MCW9037097.1 T9SS type A sorting domain-containing protein [Altibacter sp.]
MKKITILLCLLSVTQLFAQTTFEVDWDQSVGGAATFTIETGDTVKWIWANGVPHSVTSQPGSAEMFDSGILTGMGTEFSQTFTVVGSNSYSCDVHPNMTGTITVEPSLSVEEKFAKNIKLYPNPVSSELMIASLFRFDSYEIYDITGKKVGQGIGEGTYTYLNVSYLNTGVYFVKVRAGNLQATTKLIKK